MCCVRTTDSVVLTSRPRARSWSGFFILTFSHGRGMKFAESCPSGRRSHADPLTEQQHPSALPNIHNKKSHPSDLCPNGTWTRDGVRVVTALQTHAGVSPPFPRPHHRPGRAGSGNESSRLACRGRGWRPMRSRHRQPETQKPVSHPTVTH